MARACVTPLTSFERCAHLLPTVLPVVLRFTYTLTSQALPISIGLGTVFYLLTRFAIQPYIEALNQTPLYL